MKKFTPPELDDDLLTDVREEVTELYEKCTSTLIVLGQDPENGELTDTLFRHVHTIKGDIGMAQMTPLLPILMAVEDLLSMMRENTLSFSPLLSDLVLNVTEEVRYFVEDCAREGSSDYDEERLESATRILSGISADNPAEHQLLLRQALHVFELTHTEGIPGDLLASESSSLDINWAEEVEPDLIFFHSIMKPVESRMDNWDGRSSRQLKLALLLNQYAGTPVDEKQLRVAVYLHDIGMSILPLALLRKSTSLNETELNRIRGHVQRSAGFLLEMPHWSQARQFILEHHERYDGNGYPAGLKGDSISMGARILTLVDAFEAMTHERAKQLHRKRTIKHAVQEINQASGAQFCPYWVGVLNKVMASVLES